MTPDTSAGRPVASRAPTLSYRPDIDGMRAIAVMMVLIFHFSLLPGVPGGFFGVDIFFVISGFLITALVKRQLDEGRFSLKTFYLHRIRRLAPALFIVLLAVFIFGVLWLFPNELLELSKQVLAAQFYFANIYYWRNVNYFGLIARDLPLLHTWSLAAEEQFYLCYPALLLLLHRKARRHFWTALWVVLLISFALNVFFVDRKPEATFYLFPTRAWELLAGALVPVMSERWKRAHAVDEVLSIGGLALVLVSLTCFQANFGVPGYFALVPATGAACLILGGMRHNTAVSKFLALSPLVYFGRISYSLYLVHWPIHVFASQLISAYGAGWHWAMFALSIALAAALYHLVEDPIRLRRILPVNRKLLSLYAVGLTATLAAFLVINFTHGLPARFSPESIRLAAYVNDKPDPFTECEFASRDITLLPTCELGTPGQEPTWLIYGDSHAWATRAAFDLWLRNNHQAGLLVFQHGCPPLTGLHFTGAKDDCFIFNQAVTKFIEEHPTFQHIVLVSTWKWPVDGGLVDDTGRLLTPKQSIELFTERFVHSIGHLHDLSRQVYVWEPVPGGRESVPLALARAAREQRPSNVEFSLDEYRSENRLFFDALNKSSHWITASYSPSKILCSTGKCAVELDNQPLYSDTGHVTNSSVQTWVRVLQEGVATH